MENKWVKNKILNIWHNLSNSEQEVLTYVLDKLQDIKIEDLAKKTNVSKTLISNLIRKIGFDGYREFMYEIKNSNTIIEPSMFSFANITLNYYKELIDIYFDYKYDFENMELFIKDLKELKIYSFGIGSSYQALQDFKFKFSRLGKMIHVSNQRDQIILNLNTEKKERMLLITSLRGEQKEIFSLLKEVKLIKNVKVVMVTSNQKLITNKEMTVLHLPEKLLKLYQRFDNISGQMFLLPFFDIISQMYIEKNYKEILNDWWHIKKIL